VVKKAMKKITLAIATFLYAPIAFAVPAEQWILGKWRIVKVQGYAQHLLTLTKKHLLGNIL
jgi:hypothetical protein